MDVLIIDKTSLKWKEKFAKATLRGYIDGRMSTTPQLLFHKHPNAVFWRVEVQRAYYLLQRKYLVLDFPLKTNEASYPLVRNCQTIHFHLWHHCDKNARVVFSAAASESCRPNWPSVNAQLIVIKWNSDHIHFNQKRWSASYWDVQFQNRIPLRLETNIPLTAQVHKGFHERGRDCDACGSRKKKKITFKKP